MGEPARAEFQVSERGTRADVDGRARRAALLRPGRHADRHAAARLLERLGFRREGLRVEHSWINGEWTDDLLFGLLARDWR